MPQAMPLSKLISIAPRYTRSVSLTRDWDNPSALDGYILTPCGRDALGRIAHALKGDSQARAWSLTGPYGSGKSAFALFLAEVLCGREKASVQARELLKQADRPLWNLVCAKKPNLCPVLISGSREPLENAIASALEEWVKKFTGGKIPKAISKQLQGLKEQTGREEQTSLVVGLFEEVLQFLTDTEAGATGILLVVDELGKFLEYAANHPEKGDVFVLQALAEAAARAERPFFVVTILHQSIDRYTEQISPSRRLEWAKIQGRFEDIAFEESSEQLLRLLSKAITTKGERADPIIEAGVDLAEEAWTLGLRVGSLDKREFISLLAECSPIHPTTALVLCSVFRRLAQNERSLFAFLSSGEPYGFQEFLQSEYLSAGKSEPFRLDRLFDYVTTSLGGALYSQYRGKVWAEVQSALDRLHDASPLELRVAKAIGLLQGLGHHSVGLPASKEVIAFALENSESSEKKISQAIDKLTEKSIAVYHDTVKSNARWEESDGDIKHSRDYART